MDRLPPHPDFREERASERFRFFVADKSLGEPIGIFYLETPTGYCRAFTSPCKQAGAEILYS